jgi:hypothetical protein
MDFKINNGRKTVTPLVPYQDRSCRDGSNRTIQLFKENQISIYFLFFILKVKHTRHMESQYLNITI